MKMLITSPDAIFDQQTGKPFEDIIAILEGFAKQKDNIVATISLHDRKLAPVPKGLHPIQLSAKDRGYEVVLKIFRELNVSTNEVIILGCKDMDMFLAANNKLLLLRADYSSKNNPRDRIFSRKYGLPIPNPKSLQIYFDNFLNIDNPWFYSLELTHQTHIFALTDANTYTKRGDEASLSEEFRAYLKDGKDSLKTEFLIYFLTSLYLIVNEMIEVDYWGIYPSSSTNRNDDLNFFKEKAREMFKCRVKDDILIRHTSTAKRHLMSPDQRIKDGCDTQFSTITVNPAYRGNLKGKVVCIIDDFTTWGTSAETARHLMEAAGVRKFIFIALGKYGKKYIAYQYEMQGDVFDSYTYKQINRTNVEGVFNYSANYEFVKSLKVFLHGK